MPLFWFEIRDVDDAGDAKWQTGIIPLTKRTRKIRFTINGKVHEREVYDGKMLGAPLIIPNGASVKIETFEG